MSQQRKARFFGEFALGLLSGETKASARPRSHPPNLKLFAEPVAKADAAAAHSISDDDRHHSKSRVGRHPGTGATYPRVGSRVAKVRLHAEAVEDALGTVVWTESGRGRRIHSAIRKTSPDFIFYRLVFFNSSACYRQ